jgi:Transposase, Mutator family
MVNAAADCTVAAQSARLNLPQLLSLRKLLQKSGESGFLRAVVEAVLQILVEAEVEGVIGAGRHERSAERLNYRNVTATAALRPGSGRSACASPHTSTLPRASRSLPTRRWRGMDSHLYGAFPVKRLFLVLFPVLCSERERPFFVPSPAIRFVERAEGVKGPKR